MTTMSVSSSYTSSESMLSSLSRSSFNLQTVTNSDLEPIKVFLQSAFQNQQRGQSQQYNVIVQQFCVKDDPEMLGKVVIALNSYISGILSRPDTYRALIHQILSWNWKTDMGLNVAITHLIFNIVTSNATFLSSVLRLLIKTFIPENSSAPKDHTDPFREELLSHIHSTIARIGQQVPTGLSELLKMVLEIFPHKRFSVYIQTEYIRQLLTIANSFPVLQSPILDMILQKCLEMDVEIVIEDDGEVRLQRDAEFPTSLNDDYAAEDVDDAIFGSGLSSSHRVASSSSGVAGCRSGVGSKSAATIPTEVAELAEKLDSMLAILLHYFEQYLQNHPQASDRQRFYQQLWELFQHRLLLTHKSNQFFAKRLLETIFNVQESILLRQSSMMYLASYLSRATFLSKSMIREIVADLLRWATAYVLHFQSQNISLRSSDSSSSTVAFYEKLLRHIQHRFQQELSIELVFQTNFQMPSFAATPDPSLRYEYDDYGRLQLIHHKVSQHELFYLMIQSICYIACFYGRELFEGDLQATEEVLLHHCWNVLFTCKFEPIKYVIKSIRSEFLKLAYSIQLLDPICWEFFPLEILTVEISSASVGETSLPSLLCLYQIQAATKASKYEWIGNVLAASSSSLGRSRLLQSTGNLRDSRLTTRTTSTNMFASLGPNTIESYFPFDPCLLMKTYYSIEKAYRPWNGVPDLDEVSLVHSVQRAHQHPGATQSSRTTITVNKSSASLNIEFEGEIFGEDLEDSDREGVEESEDEEDGEEEEADELLGISRSGILPMRPSSHNPESLPIMAMSMSYTETNISTSVTSSTAHSLVDGEGDGYSSSYSMSVTSSIPREQMMLELIQRSKHGNRSSRR